MFLMLHDAYGVQKNSKHTYDLAKDCMKFFGRPMRPDASVARGRISELHTHCFAGAAASSGAMRLRFTARQQHSTVSGTSRDIHAMNQIESRIGIRFEIGQPTREDCVRIGAEHNVEGSRRLRGKRHLRAKHLPSRALPPVQNCAPATSGDGNIRLPRIETMLRGRSCGSDTKFGRRQKIPDITLELVRWRS
ncbi:MULTISPECIES: hypothetical protein [unclassified Mesorhizobium]|uniref:hypothetical protein n=1 Tax=unclassified Mesorhizobium TaxID=325217 RepID=UPI001CD0CC80|nr:MULTISPECIES: hypothetical protein [unclassified Mesorhizobium]MBZ9894467.1 hypothetical protein [Mesorhizobium sp. BR1-1-6]